MHSHCLLNNRDTPQTYGNSFTVSNFLYWNLFLNKKPNSDWHLTGWLCLWRPKGRLEWLSQVEHSGRTGPTRIQRRQDWSQKAFMEYSMACFDWNCIDVICWNFTGEVSNSWKRAEVVRWPPFSSQKMTLPVTVMCCIREASRMSLPRLQHFFSYSLMCSRCMIVLSLAEPFFPESNMDVLLRITLPVKVQLMNLNAINFRRNYQVVKTPGC